MERFIREQFIPLSTQWFIRLLETICIALLFIVFGYLFHSSDPLFLKSTFPWLLFVPAFVSLRYGFWYGLLSILFLSLSVFYFESAIVFQTPNYYYIFIGAVLLAFICGEFNEAFRYKILRAQQINSYEKAQYNHLAYAYNILKLSHDRLEQSVITKPVTLSKIFNELRELLVQSQGNLNDVIGRRLIGLLEQYSYLTKAALYTVDQGNLITTPVASIGHQDPLVIDDILVQTALLKQTANYFAVNGLLENQKSHYVATIPMRSSDGKMHALFVIEEMSFWSCNEDVLRIIYALLSYFSDEIWAAQQASIVLEKYQSCPLLFAASLYKLQRLRRDAYLESSLVAFIMPKKLSNAEKFLINLRQEQRAIDYTWMFSDAEYHVLIVLKPFFKSNQGKQYVQDIQSKVSEDKLRVLYQPVTESQPIDMINHLLRAVYGR